MMVTMMMARGYGRTAGPTRVLAQNQNQGPPVKTTRHGVPIEQRLPRLPINEIDWGNASIRYCGDLPAIHGSPSPPSRPILSHATVIYSYAPIDEIDTYIVDRDSLPLGALTPCLVPPYSRINPSASRMISLHYPDGTLVSPQTPLTAGKIRLPLSAAPYIHPTLLAPFPQGPVLSITAISPIHLLQPVAYQGGT